jgi:hypothetical protein
MAKKDLTEEQLSESYSIACLRLHNEITKLYEDLHGEIGDPCTNSGLVSNMVSAVRVILNHELDFIKEASYQHQEANHDQSEQTDIFFGDGESS